MDKLKRKFLKNYTTELSKIKEVNLNLTRSCPLLQVQSFLDA
ncbi:hypothetical protein DB44_CJ00170 [Candidatus Protochlamydia amoebophila]|uniref:Uncharacterized protein n=1 Tax=Candidatus Protochlamydia amoebophila TaxID=362787 RepID=A0A0C1HC90_9BACT|nr:hypothetical protein DB44_CJ00170 [Candidatus Protochlamydia amoebophila]